MKKKKKKKKKDSEKREPKKEKNLILKAERNDSSGEDNDMAYLTRRFQKMVRKNGGISKRGSSSKLKNYDLCHKCGKPGHFIKDCSLLKQDHFKHNSEKVSKRNLVPDKCFKRKNVVDIIVKQALTTWADSSSESEEEGDVRDNSMMAVESETNEYDSIFALMAQSDDDEDDDNDEVNFQGFQRNLKSYSLRKLMSLANVLIDAYHSLVNDKNALTKELGDAEQTRDDLVVCVVDLKETIVKKDALVEKMVVIEQERDDLLVLIVDLKETMEELKTEYRSGNSEKGKEVASEAHIKLENKLNAIKTSLCAELEKNRQQQQNWKEHFNENGQARVQSLRKNKVFAERVTAERGPGNSERKQSIMVYGQWMLKAHDWEYHDFLSLKSLQGGSVSFENGKKGYIHGVGKIEKSLTRLIENVYYVNGLKYSLLSVSQICDKGNKVEFLSKICTVTNLVTGEVILVI
ncbi:uncharacterized protein [Nicotiana sylvestris]|uniref:uncharacterized protein n=1 Tax=Nicotiana sylvestris TaxID=4096 RepID=UPI00388C5C48